MTSITAGQSDPPVIVVGAGPVGMTATAMLSREGIPVVLIEAEPVPKTDWRASSTPPRSNCSSGATVLVETRISRLGAMTLRVR
jgi:cation diffusion facilitator CzcD-associated flavoprotein CzcO